MKITQCWFASKTIQRWFALGLLALGFTVGTQAEAAKATGYVRAREFSMRFSNVISSRDQITFTIGREDKPNALRLQVKAGSYVGYMVDRRDFKTSRMVFSRGVKVDDRGLLLPVEALRGLGCRVWPYSSTQVRVVCDGKSYRLQRYAR
jgi:hypothetical protein